MRVHRDELHRLVDSLPEEVLPLAQRTLSQWQTPPASDPAHPHTAVVEHAAAWVADLERARAFYERWLGAKAAPLYSSARRSFHSHFLTLGSGARLELMESPGEAARPAHIAVSVGSPAALDRIVAQMQADGITVANRPRLTGDGCYEATVLDSEGNPLELTV